MDIYQQKKVLRKEIREIKNTYTLEQKKAISKDILSRVESLPEFLEAGCIMAYWSMDDEVYTHDLIEKWSRIKQIILPVVKGDQLQLKLFRGEKALKAGEKFGIPEPTGELFTDYDEIELVIVPGVAFDRQNNRMGRGKAYYDQLLKELKAFKLGICFQFQLLEKIPHDDLDIKMDLVITNKK